jgi:5,6-dimethylbenzimidazole synthase
MDYEGFLKLVKTRRSIRSFKAEPIPDEYVERIIEVARWAPSGANSQPWEFIIVKDKEIKDKIIDIVNEHSEFSRKVELTREEHLRFPAITGPVREPGFKNAPVFIILCGDPRTKEAYPLLTMLTRGDSHFTSSLASAFLYMTLAATALGLGSQWVSATGNPFVKCLLRGLLEIPEKLEIYDMLVLGYPTYEPKPRLLWKI